MDRGQMLVAVSNLTSAVQRNEHGKNDLIEQILCDKLSRDFVVMRKSLTSRKGMSVSPYSRSRPDIKVQHKEKCFRSGTVMLAAVSSPQPVFTIHEDDKEHSYTAIMEFNTGSFAKDQTLANMLCSGADGSVEILRHGKRISMTIIYNFSVNYETNKTNICKMTLDFENSYDVRAVENKVTLLEAINYMVAILKK